MMKWLKRFVVWCKEPANPNETEDETLERQISTGF